MHALRCRSQADGKATLEEHESDRYSDPRPAVRCGVPARHWIAGHHLERPREAPRSFQVRGSALWSGAGAWSSKSRDRLIRGKRTGGDAAENRFRGVNVGQAIGFSGLFCLGQRRRQKTIVCATPFLTLLRPISHPAEAFSLATAFDKTKPMLPWRPLRSRGQGG